MTAQNKEDLFEMVKQAHVWCWVGGEELVNVLVNELGDERKLAEEESRWLQELIYEGRIRRTAGHATGGVYNAS